MVAEIVQEIVPMKIALLSDIHANPSALNAVLADSHQWNVDGYWFMGDVVGYGIDPVTPIQWIRENLKPGDWVLGNHEIMLHNQMLGRDNEGVAQEAQEAITRHKALLREQPEVFSFFVDGFLTNGERPVTHDLDGVDYVLVHGDQENPTRYIYSWLRILIPSSFDRLFTQAHQRHRPRVQIYGHTHIPALIIAHPTSGQPLAEDPIDTQAYRYEPVRVLPGETYELNGWIAMINPGSVGQPRDLDHRASYAILDTTNHRVTFRRVEYDWREMARQLDIQRYPDSLIYRLMDARPPRTTPQEWKDHFQQAKGVPCP